MVFFIQFTPFFRKMMQKNDLNQKYKKNYIKNRRTSKKERKKN